MKRIIIYLLLLGLYAGNTSCQHIDDLSVVEYVGTGKVKINEDKFMVEIGSQCFYPTVIYTQFFTEGEVKLPEAEMDVTCVKFHNSEELRFVFGNYSKAYVESLAMLRSSVVTWFDIIALAVAMVLVIAIINIVSAYQRAVIQTKEKNRKND